MNQIPGILKVKHKVHNGEEWIGGEWTDYCEKAGCQILSIEQDGVTYSVGDYVKISASIFQAKITEIRKTENLGILIFLEGETHGFIPMNLSKLPPPQPAQEEKKEIKVAIIGMGAQPSILATLAANAILKAKTPAQEDDKRWTDEDMIGFAEAWDKHKYRRAVIRTEPNSILIELENYKKSKQ